MRRSSPMTMPRTSKAVRDRPGVQARLLPNPFPPPGIMPLTTHNKRCPKAQRLGLRSDLSPSRPSYGRSPDKTRHTLRKGRCQVRAPLTGRKVLAASGDAPEHGVMSLHRAIAPFSDSTVAALGEADPLSGGHESPLPFLRMVEHFRWTGLPQTENISGPATSSRKYGAEDSTVVTTGKLRSTNGGHGSPLPSLGMVEHFRWTGLPQSENISRPVRIPSEVWGCRRVVADADRPQGRTPRIGTGVADIMHKRPGPSTPLFSSLSFRCPARNLGQAPVPSHSTGEDWGLSPVSRGSEGDPLPSLLSGTELRAEVGAEEPISASVPISPSPLTRPFHSRHTCSRTRHPRLRPGIHPVGWGLSTLRLPSPIPLNSFPPSPLGKDISKMQCIFDMSTKTGRVGKTRLKGAKVPSPSSPSTKLEGCTCALAQVHPSVFPSPSPLKALRERGIKGVRVPPSHPLNNQTRA